MHPRSCCDEAPEAFQGAWGARAWPSLGQLREGGFQGPAELCKLAEEGSLRFPRDCRAANGPSFGRRDPSWALGLSSGGDPGRDGRDRGDTEPRRWHEEESERRRIAKEGSEGGRCALKESTGSRPIRTCPERLRTLRNAEGPRGARNSRKKDKRTQSPRKAGLGQADQEKPRDLETARGRARAERASAQSRAAAGGGRAAVVLLILGGFSLSEALSVTQAQRRFIILQRGPAARCDPAA